VARFDRRETILIVEDDPMVRPLVVRPVTSLGYVALTAANAGEALAAIDGGQEIDLLFTDLTMPGGMNGRLLADEALRRRPSLKILFTSGHSDESISHDGHLDDDRLLLTKPYRKSDLALMIRSALAADAKPQSPAQVSPLQSPSQSDVMETSVRAGSGLL
jgi:CheY-like chemotaxis protein